MTRVGLVQREAEDARLGRLVFVMRLGRKVYLTLCRFCYIQLGEQRRARAAPRRADLARFHSASPGPAERRAAIAAG